MLLKRTFYYRLPQSLIAQSLTHPRDMCRLMVVRWDGSISHRRFLNLPELLPKDSILVLNRTRVIPALLEARKETGGRIELLFVDLGGEERPKAFLKGKVREGVSGRTPTGTEIRVMKHLREGLFEVEVIKGEARRGEGLLTLLKEEGKTPLPPYIKRRDLPEGEYQTVYAE
ncbi:MAG: tRNA preQ1(34) S-adenosylmethionine ribosyltransferase-isomerase QueA, partial [Candidatus Latescibacterota bacterium]